MARSVQTHKNISFIWIVWSTLYVYFWLICQKLKYQKVFSFANEKRFWQTIRNCFWHLDRANSIKTTLHTCNLWTNQSVSYEFVNWSRLRLLPLFFLFQNFPISLSDFYLIVVKSDNEIGKFSIKIWNVPGGFGLLSIEFSHSCVQSFSLWQ
jgi:hypothetical protein